MGAIKMFAMLPRRPDLAAQAFHDHWRHPHGTFGRTISTVHRYVQSHQLHTDRLGDGQSAYDGIVEVWFECLADAAGLPGHPTYQRHLVPDEPRFIDMDRIRYVFTEEEVVASGRDPAAFDREGDLEWDPEQRPTAIKLIQLFAPEAGDWAHEEDAALGARLGALRHVRCRPSADLHPDGAAFGGIRELWWPTLSAFEAGVAAAGDAWERLLARPSGSISILVQAERFL